MTISGQTLIDYVALDRKTLYTNPYLIVTEAEYTKHYYAESQRIASKLGGGWANALVDPLNDHLPDTLGFEHLLLNDLLIDRLETLAECVGLEARNAWYFDAFEAIADQHGVSAFEASQYFYHPDHLGSSSFITNAGGDVDQHLQYLPFGEPWIDQRTQNNIRFTFSGKERDDETGYNYFGARYYNADISIWLSVDPLSDQAPGWTPYRYGFNNPIQFVDPNGMLEDWYQNSETQEIHWFDNDAAADEFFGKGNWENKGATYIRHNENSGNHELYASNGQSYEYAIQLAKTDVDGGKMGDYGRALHAGRSLGIYRGQEDFIKGTLMFGMEISNKIGQASTAIGYGAAFIPGAQVAAGGLIAAGSGLSTVSSLGQAAMNFSDGNNKHGTMNLANAGISLLLGNSLGGIATQQGKNILWGGIEVKSGIANYLINRD